MIGYISLNGTLFVLVFVQDCFVSCRVNGFKKQQEILRQKHAEFLERYKLRQSGREK